MVRGGGWPFGRRGRFHSAGVVVERMPWLLEVGGCCNYVVEEEVRWSLGWCSWVDCPSMIQNVGKTRMRNK